MPANMQTETELRAVIAANPNSDLLRWLGPRVLKALLPIAQGLVLKLVLRWATTLGLTLIALAEKTGLAADVDIKTKIVGAFVLLATFLVDWLVSYISTKLHTIPKALPVGDDEIE